MKPGASELIARLDRSVSKSDGCWDWTGARTAAGYGHFYIRGQHFYAHRLSFELNVGSIAVGLVVCHRCDRPSCVRPDHLFLGTDKDNSDDKIRKGRLVMPPVRKGADHHSARLSADNVRSIRSSFACGESGRALASRFGVSASAVSAIVRGRTWSHVA